MLKIKFTSLTLLLLMLVAGFTSCSQEDDNDPVIVDPSLNVTPATMAFNATGGTKGMQITSNTGWTITGAPNWLSFSEPASEGTMNIQVTAQPNELLESRSATLTISADNGDLTDEVQVTQEAGEEPDEQVKASIPPDNSGMRDMGSVQLSDQMGIGWNLGNSLEAIGGETAWGNPVVTESLIDSVKAAGFNAVRIPVAWSKFSDAENFTIRETWMNRVEEVVNYVLDNDMYAIINIHWDGGWMQPTYDEQEYVNARLDAMWQQIAIRFRDYEDKLLFAGTNEVMVEGDYGTPTEEYYTVQNSFNQTFINTVRETGGRNHYRHLVVQGFNTNINHTVNYAVIPEDVVDNRLFMEVHYYDPYNFTLNENSNVYQWGDDASESEDWANESYVDNQFQKMKTNFIDKGIGVILGEYGAIKREGVEGHEAYREYYLEYVTRAALEHGLVPIYWDNGDVNDLGFALFDRNTGETLYPGLLNAIMDTEE
ncbi:cellulase family glycosylhydrolase [Salinimicrobium sp. TH3]|uniref:cellulase family glycosylhydrolase n=1 Tax=Salinimicrobium sp. TH3 TaxID=2997342 RepID=UPI00227641C0|nr:cellulase family glycosylhydrolase [Salinimicrobium sp. TH3]MCY2687527.1 cellulase family glycosylhydrolase [Salinimicrobium sp. TH3]